MAGSDDERLVVGVVAEGTSDSGFSRMLGSDTRCNGSLCSSIAAAVARAHTATIFRRLRTVLPSTSHNR
ncbi:hypothetical protein D3C72_2362540 [compost metagenome]